MNKFLGFCIVLNFHLAIVSKDYKTDNIYVNSIPKCGTHLLTRCVELLTGRPLKELPRDLVTSDHLPRTNPKHYFYATHVAYSQKAASVFKKHNYKVLFIYRDPRDQLISHVHFIHQGGFKGQNIHNPLRKLPFDQLLSYLIKRINQKYNTYIPWLARPDCCAVRFEDLVGPHGGGNSQSQINAIKKIAQYLEVPLSEEHLQYCIKNLFGKTITFRRGKIGEWKKRFKPYHKQAFKKTASHLLKRLGYA